MSDVILLVGLPGSGKSTLARQLARWGKGWAVISTDVLRKQLFGDETIQGPWSVIQRELARSLQSAAQAAAQGEIEGAIYDATNAVRKHRRRAIALCRQSGFTRITVLWLDVPLEICLERNARRSRQVPIAIIARMHRRLQSAPPDLAEGVERVLRYRGF